MFSQIYINTKIIKTLKKLPTNCSHKINFQILTKDVRQVHSNLKS